MVTVSIISQFYVKVKHNVRDTDILFERMLRGCGDAGNTEIESGKGGRKPWFKMTTDK